MKSFYWSPASTKIRVNPNDPALSTDDVLEVEYWVLGVNYIVTSDQDEIDALVVAENGGGGTYEIFLDDPDCKDIEQARARNEQFLDEHAPGRLIGAPGTFPRELRWVSYSFEDKNSELIPGVIVSLNPTLPNIGGATQALITQVVATDVPRSHGPRYLRSGHPQDRIGGGRFLKFELTAVDLSRITTDAEYFGSLAEIGGGQNQTQQGTYIRNAVIIKLVEPLAVGTDVADHAEIGINTNDVFRCRAARVYAKTPSTGADIKIDLQYSTDPYNTAYASRTWNPLFLDTTGRLILPATQMQMSAPLTTFASDPLDLPAGTLIRCNVIQVGSGTIGDLLTIEVVGEIRRRAA